MDDVVEAGPVGIVLVIIGYQQGGQHTRVLARDGLLPCFWLGRSDHPTRVAADGFKRLTGVTARTEPGGDGWVPLTCADPFKLDGVPALVFTAAYDPGAGMPLVSGFSWSEINTLTADAALLMRAVAGRI